MRALQHAVGRLGAPRKLGVLAVVFVAIVACLLVLVHASFDTMTGVRAFVGGESHWSKAQKDAVLALSRAAGGDRRALAGFRAAIAVPLGDRAARRALEAPVPDHEAAHRGFVAGRNHPADAPSMITVFRRLRTMPYVSDAIRAWRATDPEVSRLVAIAHAIDRELERGPLTARTTARFHRKLAVVNDRTTPLADTFSSQLGEGARLLAWALPLVLTVTASFLVCMALLLARALGTAVRRSEARAREMTRALTASEERYRELFDNANDLVYAHDLEGNFLSVNRASLRVTGYTQEEIIGRNISTILPPEQIERAREMITRKVTGGGATTYELEIVARDGRRIPVEVSTRLVVDDGRAVAVHGVARDISERKRAEAALTQEARVAGALAHAARELISALETPVLYDRLCQVSAAVVGGTASTTMLWQEATSTYVRVAEFGDPVALDAKRVALGTNAPAMRAEPLRALDDHTLAITLRNGADAVGVQLVAIAGPIGREHLRIGEGVAAIAAMALANANLVGRLAEASRLKSEFVSTMSHELRTPLNVMLGYTEMVREAPTDAERVELLHRIEIAGRDLLELIESTLEIGRIEAGRDAARFEATTLRALLGTIGDGCARLPRRAGVELRWPTDLPEATIRTDPRKVTVILRNLVGNALKFTEHGFVALEVVVDPDMVTLVVRDTGIGIRREDQRHVFEMFRQADGSDSRRFGGTGLGLYIVRRFVQQLDGAIALESEPGRGASFTIVLPRVPTPDSVSDAA